MELDTAVMIRLSRLHLPYITCMASLTPQGTHVRLAALLLAFWFATAANALSVSSTVLVFARDTASSYSATSGFKGYRIPFQVVIVPQGGTTLPSLNDSTTQGNYGGIVVLSEVAYSYDDLWASALTSSQWQQLYDYQSAFGVRMVRLDVYPGPNFGKQSIILNVFNTDAVKRGLTYHG